jgi:hypothetical protein
MGKMQDMLLRKLGNGPAFTDDNRDMVLATFTADSDNRVSIIDENDSGNIASKLGRAFDQTKTTGALHDMWVNFTGCDELPVQAFFMAGHAFTAYDRIYLTYRKPSRTTSNYTPLKTARKPITDGANTAQIIGEWHGSKGAHKLTGFRIAFNDTFAFDIAIDGRGRLSVKKWTLQTLWGYLKPYVKVCALQEARALTRAYDSYKHKETVRNVYHNVTYRVERLDSGAAL